MMSRSMRLIVLAACFAIVPAVSACPTCARGLASSDARNKANNAAAFNASILFMASMPFAITGFFGITFWRLSRQASETEEAGGSDTCQPSCKS